MNRFKLHLETTINKKCTRQTENPEPFIIFKFRGKTTQCNQNIVAKKIPAFVRLHMYSCSQIVKKLNHLFLACVKNRKLLSVLKYYLILKCFIFDYQKTNLCFRMLIGFLLPLLFELFIVAQAISMYTAYPNKKIL